MPEHAKLSPSSAGRWINCPLSIKLSEPFPDTTNSYAAEGSLAHAIAAKKLLKEPYAALKKDPLFEVDMEMYTDEYVDYIKKITNSFSGKPIVQVETKLDLSFIAPNTFGTADCILMHGKDLHVIDFKYGKNVKVDADHNSQMMIYALGAINLYDGLVFNFENIHLHIIQPRMNNFSRFSIPKADIQNWCKEVVRPAARKALDGEGEAVYGEWCKFCKAKPVCRAYGNRFNVQMKPDDPDKLTNAEIADRIRALKGLDSYLKTLQNYALNEALKGKRFPGFKVVEGRSTRQWKNEEKALKIAQNEGYEVYETKPLSLSKIEKMMGSKAFKLLLGDEVEKPKGKPTLVPDSDKRESLNSAIEEFKDIQI